ncbi:MAG: TIGR00366 family protein [Gammaproteobacteria bacterium]|nr:TIGR00366 family protein [Gammaproteobacteria bacterium]
MDSLRSLGDRFSRMTERWMPDPWVVCMMLTLIAFILAIGFAGVGFESAVLAWGGGIWGLLALAMQFTIALVAAYACVTSPMVFRMLDRLAALPNPDRPTQGLVLVALVSMSTGFINWAVCMIFSALFVPFVCRRNPKTDVRLLVAGAYVGMGTVWHGGLSGSAPLIMATPGNPLLAPVSGQPVVDRLYPVTETIFSGFNLFMVAGLAVIALVMLVILHPKEKVVTLSAERLRAILPEPPETPDTSDTPAGWLDSSRFFCWFAALMVGYALVYSVVTKGFGASWNINAYNSLFLALALALHGRPATFVAACRKGLDPAFGIVLQFPFYAGLFGLMVDTGLGGWIGGLFSHFATADLYPLVVYAYSALMNLFVPSGGSKWMIEAPYLLPAGGDLGVSVRAVLIPYMYGDSITNLIHPIWALPLLAVTRLRFGEFAGYTLLIALACGLFSVAALTWVMPQDF